MGGLKAFFASPFAPEYQWVRNGVAKACRQLDIELRAVDERAKPGANLVVAIHEEIEGADLVVAVVTGLNPNVMYELGRALQASKPTVLLADEDTFKALPFDIRTLATIRYDSQSKNEGELAVVVAGSLALARDALSTEFRREVAAGKYRNKKLAGNRTAVSTRAVTAIDFEEIREQAEKRMGKSNCKTIDIETKDNGWFQKLQCPCGDVVIVIIDINGEIVRTRLN